MPALDKYTTTATRREEGRAALSHIAFSGLQLPGVVPMPPEEMSALVAALERGDAARLPNTPLTDVAPLGAGGYATVYAATLAADGGCGRAGDAVALKVAAPASAWEFYLQREVARRVPRALAPHFMPAHALFVGAEPRWSGGLRKREGGADAADPRGAAGVIVMPRGLHGNLLDLVNAHFGRGAAVGDSLLLYLSLQLLQVRSLPPCCHLYL